jgi:cystathionine beta-synthase
VEPSSGNTGIGLAMVAASRGYKTIITMPERVSQEKEDLLKALGAGIEITPTELPYDHVHSNIGIAY